MCFGFYGFRGLWVGGCIEGASFKFPEDGSTAHNMISFSF